ncbi:flagellar motor switch protein FliG [Bdellovibrio bacteriovorus]|uniref:flagellar motor switch protein FliG n=1 Tax=Bdellovibrio bacteriovorus TaxID=959 RepID=UPI0021CFC04E|nr:flagellar motor switch protein FliG [Bdellovibrio bacteriovorus]UXR64259.1 flagellar motor switch protein FliG [Bdellovibrio bacteriovorus]
MKLHKSDNIEYENLKGFDKAAILINYLGKDAVKVLLRRMDDSDIRKLINQMSKLRVVPVHVTKRVLEEYYEMISETEDYIFSENISAKDTIVDALGEERARGILGGLNITSGGSRSLESLEMVDAKSLATFLVNEHPQTVAVILAHLEPEKKGEVLKRLPEALQAEVVLRMANLEHVDPELIAEIDRVLKNQLSNNTTVEQAALGGVHPVAEMLNVMDKNTETAIMSRLEEKDPLLAEEIRKLMFVFDDIVKIDDRGIQSLLKEVANEKLLLALKTSSEEIRTKIFKNISARAAEMLREDLSNMGPSRLSDVESAQQEIVNVARRLEAEGKILIARGGSEDAMV